MTNETTPPVAVLDGWKPVPERPTIEMVEAGYEVSLGEPDRSGRARVFDQYKAMLAAAPTPPAGQREIPLTVPDELRAKAENFVARMRRGAEGDRVAESELADPDEAQACAVQAYIQENAAAMVEQLLAAMPTTPAPERVWPRPTISSPAQLAALLNGVPALHEIGVELIAECVFEQMSPTHNELAALPAQQPAGHFVRRSGFGPHVEVDPTEVGAFPLYAAPPAQQPVADNARLAEALTRIAKIPGDSVDYHASHMSRIAREAVGIYQTPGDTAAPEPARHQLSAEDMARVREAAKDGLLATTLHSGAVAFLNDGSEPDYSHLNCPACGGSGHIDDVQNVAPEQAEQDAVTVPRELRPLLEKVLMNLSEDPEFHTDPMTADYCIKLRALLEVGGE